MKRKKYSLAFKANAVRTAERIGFVEASKKLGVRTSLLYGWRRSQVMDDEKAAVENGELTALRKKVAEQDDEIRFYRRMLRRFLDDQTLRSG